MKFFELQEKAESEGIKLTLQDYRFAYAIMLGETNAEAALFSSTTKVEVDRKMARKKGNGVYNRMALKLQKKDSVIWVLKELAMVFPDKIRRYQKVNFSAEGVVESKEKRIRKAIEKDDGGKASINEIEELLTDLIREVKEDRDIPIKERLSIIPAIKLMIDKLRPIDHSQDDIDRVLVECIEPANTLCPHCNREYLVKDKSEKKIDTQNSSKKGENEDGALKINNISW